MVRDLATPFRPVNLERSILGVEIQELLRTTCAHGIHGLMLEHYQSIGAIPLALHQHLLFPDDAPLQIPSVLIGDELVAHVEELAP